MNNDDFKTGPFHIMNPVPENDEEVLKHGNALAASGNYPVGTNACFNVGISGGCGIDCFEYRRGGCDEPQELVPRIEDGEAEDWTLEDHYELYPK